MIEEAKLILDPLEKYVQRVTGLLVEFPDHPILLQLKKLATRILRYSVSRKSLT